MNEQALPLNSEAIPAGPSDPSELEQQLARAEYQYGEARARYFRVRDDGPVFTNPKDTLTQLEFIPSPNAPGGPTMLKDPRDERGWSPFWWADYHPLQIQKASHVTVSTFDLDQALGVYLDVLHGTLLHEGENPFHPSAQRVCVDRRRGGGVGPADWQRSFARRHGAVPPRHLLPHLQGQRPRRRGPAPRAQGGRRPPRGRRHRRDRRRHDARLCDGVHDVDDPQRPAAPTGPPRDGPVPASLFTAPP